MPLGQIFSRHEVRDERLASRVLQSGEHGKTRGADVEDARGDDAGDGAGHQEQGDHELGDLRAHHDAASIYRIREQATEEGEPHLRDRARETEQADLERRIGQLVDLPGHGHAGELVGDNGECLTQPERAEVMVERPGNHARPARGSERHQAAPLVADWVRRAGGLG